MATKIPIVDYSGKFGELQPGDTISVSGGITLVEAEIDFGVKPVRSKRFTISSIGTTSSNKIIAFPSGNVATGRGQDDWEWDTVNFSVKGTTDAIIIYAYSNTRIGGKRKIYYSIN